MASLSGNDLNGIINIDKTNFIKINLFKTKFNFKGLDIAKSDLAKALNNINLRFIGRDIQTEDELFQDVNFYILKNRDILTIDNIIVDSKRFKIGTNSNDEKAYISYNSIKDLYKVRGAYNFDNSSGYFNDIFNYDFDILESDLNIQWNSFNALINLEGEIYFLVKDLNLNREIPESTLLRALKILNLNAIVDGSDESSGSKLFINRAAGNIILGNEIQDNITVSGQFDSDLIPSASALYDIGSSTKKWKKIFAVSASFDNLSLEDKLIITRQFILP